MTIDSGWNKLIKTAVPHAFHPKLQGHQCPATVFIDGQIKLMCSSSIQLWSVFFKAQFLNCIDQAFATGARVVVLSFDDYNSVPASKHMTQQKRSKHVPAMDFKPGDELPPIMPSNWPAAMRNRTFKVKVIQMIVNNLRLHYNRENDLDQKGRTLVVDFIGVPDVFGTPITLPDLSGKRGECDIKAFSWTGYGPLLIFSTDGDFIPISLVQLEQTAIQTGRRQQIFLLRMKTNITPPGKRTREEAYKREYEYVDMHSILDWVAVQMQTVGVVGSPAQNFAALVASTGCDFTMNLPAIGPTKLWSARHQLRGLNVTTTAGLLLGLTRVYHKLYEKKVPVLTQLTQSNHDLDTSAKLYADIANAITSHPKISAQVKSRTWTFARMKAHVCNTNWTLQYWMFLQNYPDPLHEKFGFTRKGRQVVFEGDV